MPADGRSVAKDKGKDKDDGEGSNLVPAIVIAIGFVLFGKFAAAGNTPPPLAEASPTTAHGAESGTDPAADMTGDHVTADPDGETPTASTADDHAEPTTTMATIPHWEYEGEHGPVHWAEITDKYAACADGTKQSPIDIKDPVMAPLQDIAFAYSTMDGTNIDNGHALQVKFEAGNSITVDGVKFELKQMHFHTPSEHTFDGKSHDAELHLVHADADGNLAVVGLLIDSGSANERLKPLFDAVPDEGTADKATETPSGGPYELGLLLPDDRSTIRYEGSLTTPPCSETVQWLVVREPITLSEEQLATLAERHPDNLRPPQKLNGRTVLADKGPDA